MSDPPIRNVRACIDEPVAGASIARGVARVSGWVFDDTGLLESALLLVDDGPGTNVRLGVWRPDVGEAYPSVPHASSSGFEGTVDLCGGAGETARIALLVRLGDDTWREAAAVDVATAAPTRERDGSRPRAAFTIVNNESMMLPLWLDYYSRYFDGDDLYVLDHDSTDRSTAELDGRCHVVPVHRQAFDHHWLKSTVELFQAFLLRSYDAVLFAEADEFVVADPLRYTGLDAYIVSWRARRRGARGSTSSTSLRSRRCVSMCRCSRNGGAGTHRSCTPSACCHGSHCAGRKASTRSTMPPTIRRTRSCSSSICIVSTTTRAWRATGRPPRATGRRPTSCRDSAPRTGSSSRGVRGVVSPWPRPRRSARADPRAYPPVAVNALVVPTNSAERLGDFLAAWAPWPWDRIVIVQDAPKVDIRVPEPLRVAAANRLDVFCWADIEAMLNDPSIISRQDSAIRSFGFWHAWATGAEVIFTLDDDCLPAGDDIVAMHRNNLFSTPAWQSSVPGMHVRGLPYRNAGVLHDVHLSMGLWEGCPDIDAVMTLSGAQFSASVSAVGTRVMSSAQYFPLSGMNLAFRRDIACLMYFRRWAAGSPTPASTTSGAG